jgi:pimeloyl-ACP methyl ester carboxylesterase
MSRLAYEQVGGGPDLVLVPGTFSDRRTWLRLLGALSPQFRCLLLDPRGTGATPDPGVPFTVDDLAEDVLGAMDAAGVRRAHLVGHSLGAAVALLMAARHPARVDRAVLIGPAFLADAYLGAVLDHWEALARSDLPAAALHLGLVLPAFGRDAFERLVPAVVQDMNRRPLARAAILRYVDCDRAQELGPVAGRVDAPVLVVAGAGDGLTGPVHARALAGAIPEAAVRLVPDCGHTPHVERPAELARLVVPFLKGRPP